MRFIETPIFTKAIDNFLTPDQLLALQAALLSRPDLGRAIKGSGELLALANVSACV